MIGGQREPAEILARGPRACFSPVYDVRMPHSSWHAPHATPRRLLVATPAAPSSFDARQTLPGLE